VYHRYLRERLFVLPFYCKRKISDEMGGERAGTQGKSVSGVHIEETALPPKTDFMSEKRAKRGGKRFQRGRGGKKQKRAGTGDSLRRKEKKKGVALLLMLAL